MEPIVIEVSEEDFGRRGLKMSDYDIELLGGLLETIIQEDFFDSAFALALIEYDAMVDL